MKYDAFSKCHPLVNFIFFLGAIGFGVVIQHPAYIAAGCLWSGAYLLLLNRRTGWKLILGMVPLFVIVSAVNPLFGDYGQTVLFTVFGHNYTLEALYYGMAVSGIFVVMILWFSCYSRVLTSDKFVCLFGSLIPALSLLLVMVLRMIPNFARKTRQILGSRKAIGRGAGEGSTAREKLLDATTILSALTDWALEGSIVTADSMRSRGYGCARRTSFQIYRITGMDIVLLVGMVLLGGTVLLAGGTAAVYTPEVSLAVPGWGLAAYCGFLMIPVLLHVREAVLWHISISGI